MTKDKHINISDNELVALFLRTQEDHYFDILYHRYSSKVYAKCISILNDEETAKDATQEIFIKVILNLSKFKSEAKLSTWIYAVTYNACIDRIRKRKKNRKSSLEEAERFGEVAEGAELEVISDAELLEMQVQQLQKVLKSLPDQDRIILLMKYQDEMSIKEIGGILDLADSAVKMRISRAKAKAKRKHEEILNIK